MTTPGAELDEAVSPPSKQAVRISVVATDACAEQQAVLESLLRGGLYLADVARLLVTTTNSVAAWRDGEKPAAGRARRRLLELSRMTSDELKAALAGSATYSRGRLTSAEEEGRVSALRAAGLWPLDVCTRRISELSTRARERGLTSTDLIEFLGVARRTFYHYLSPSNTRPPPLEVVRRLQLLEEYLAQEEQGGSPGLRLLTSEGRFERASIILFDKLHYVGFAPGDPVKEHALRVLADQTHFDPRTLRRYLPVRDPGRRVNRAVVVAFEGAARRLGTIV